MMPGILIRVIADAGLAENRPGSLGVVWRSDGDDRAIFVLENGETVNLGWTSFHQLTAVVGFDNVAAEALSLADITLMNQEERRSQFQPIFFRAKPSDDVLA